MWYDALGSSLPPKSQLRKKNPDEAIFRGAEAHPYV
jgi:hypothetical protein